ncbi:MAG: sodium:solute symporter family protein [Campylobacteraceae bacterium]|jgi:SSS family solute:Na+ symporter|nr:sodium:solute symporter family protein [Campylobacteraceae bacterium]
MGIWENIFIIVYLAVIGYLGFVGYKSTKNSTDYLLAGRNTHPVVMSLSYGATFISTSAIVGFSGVAAWLGSSMIWLAFANLFVGIFIAFVVFGDRTRRMGIRLGAHTFPEFLGKRFDSKFIQIFGGLIITIFMPLYASAVLIGGTHFIASYFGADYHLSLLIFSIIITGYVIAGGLKSVMLTDALQGAIMFVAIVALVIFAFNAIGGVEELSKFDTVWQHTVLPLESVPVGDFQAGSPNLLLKISTIWGFEGWNKMPQFLSDGWLFLITSLVLGVGIGVLAQPQLVVRFMTVKSKQELNRGVLIGGIFIFGVMGLTYLIGALTNVWFYEYNEGRNALQSAGGVEQVMPLFITMAMPKWFSFIFLFALISAAMSTLASQFHTMGTAIGRDIYEQVFKAGKSSMFITRVGVVVMILFAVILSYIFDKQPAIIARSTAIFFALCASVFLPSYFGAIFWRKITKTGAIASMFVGLVTSSFWLLFVHFQEAKALGLCKFLFGADSLFSGKIIFIDALIFALPLSTITVIIVSLLTKGGDELAKRSFD